MTCLLASSVACSVVPAVLPIEVIRYAMIASIKDFQTRILRVAVTPENTTLSLSKRNVSVLRMTQCVPRCKHSPPRL